VLSEVEDLVKQARTTTSKSEKASHTRPSLIEPADCSAALNDCAPLASSPPIQLEMADVRTSSTPLVDGGLPTTALPRQQAHCTSLVVYSIAVVSMLTGALLLYAGLDSATCTALHICDAEPPPEPKTANLTLLESFTYLMFADSVSASPDVYKIAAKSVAGTARLVEMEMPPGTKDQFHEHPSQLTYVVRGGMLNINGTSYPGGETLTLPTNTTFIFPPGLHQLKNVGITPIKLVIVEALPKALPLHPYAHFKKRDIDLSSRGSSQQHQAQAETEMWCMDLLSLGPGEAGNGHTSQLIYMLEGNSVIVSELDGRGSGRLTGATRTLARGEGLAPPFADFLIRNGPQSPAAELLNFEERPDDGEPRSRCRR